MGPNQDVIKAVAVDVAGRADRIAGVIILVDTIQAESVATVERR